MNTTVFFCLVCCEHKKLEILGYSHLKQTKSKEKTLQKSKSFSNKDQRVQTCSDLPKMQKNLVTPNMARRLTEEISFFFIQNKK